MDHTQNTLTIADELRGESHKKHISSCFREADAFVGPHSMPPWAVCGRWAPGWTSLPYAVVTGIGHIAPSLVPTPFPGPAL